MGVGELTSREKVGGFEPASSQIKAVIIVTEHS
jgi:hypothetical protein